MMPTANGLSPMIPSHVLRVGQTIRMDSAQEAMADGPPGCPRDAPDLDISLENLNQLILELDPTFELLQGSNSPTCTSPPPSDTLRLDDDPRCMLVPRGCSPHAAAAPPLRATSPSVAIPSQGGLSCSPQGVLVFSSSPTCSLPPLPCGSAPRRRNDGSQGPLRPSHSNRNSAVSLLSTSTCSDTSYILGSTLSLVGFDSDSPDSFLPNSAGCFSDESRTRHSPEKPPAARRGHQQEVNGSCMRFSSSPSGSQTDIPVLLINGAARPDLHAQLAGPEMDWIHTVSAPPPPPPGSFQARFSGSQPSMKFVMDTSKFWFRPHISRAEADALVRDGEAGAFVVRDSTSFRGSFGLVMKVEPTETNCGRDAGERGSDCIRHFLIESSPKGVRIKGSSQEPYFGSLSALVYQHTVSAYALPCRLLLRSQGQGSAGQSAASEEQNKTACNFIYLDAVPTETLTGPCAVQRAVSSTLLKAGLTPTIVNLKASPKGITLTDINRKLFFRRHYPAHLLSYGGEDPDERRWMKGCTFSARMFGFVAKGVEAAMENVCHVFAEYDPLQPCNGVLDVIQAAAAGGVGSRHTNTTK